MIYLITLYAGFLKNLTGRVIFSNFSGLLLWIHVQIFFNMFRNFVRIFFETTLVDSFFKGRMLNKDVFCNYCTFQEVLRRDVFHLYGKYYFDYAEIPPWRSGILPSREGMKNLPASYKRNNKFIRKWLKSFDLAYCPVLAVI